MAARGCSYGGGSAMKTLEDCASELEAALAQESADASELLTAAKLALRVAESRIYRELEELTTVRTAIAKAEGETK
jgi:hypothetical protein